MAERYWSAGGGGDWGNAASWGGTVPVDGDTTIFPEGVSQSVTAGLDQGLIDLAALLIHKGYTGDIGNNGSPLLIAADLIEHNGAGALYVESDAGGAATKIDLIRIQCSSPGAIVEIGSASDAGDLVKIIATRGLVTIKANAKLDVASRLECGQRGGGMNDLTLTLLDFTTPGTEDLAKLRMSSGKITIHRQLADAVLAGGELIIDTQPVAVVEQFGGRFMYDHRAVSGDGTIIRGYGGALDLRHTGDIKTITRGEWHEGYVVEKDPSFHTFTTEDDFRLKQ